MKKSLKHIRELKGITQIQMADKIGLSEISYQRIEYGKQQPKLKTALLIANILNSSVEELFPVTPKHKKT